MIDYGFQHDCHVMHRWLWLCMREPLAKLRLDYGVFGTCMWQTYLDAKGLPVILPIDPEDWTRYDGELL